MPTPPLSDDVLREVVAAWRANDCRANKAAEALGMNPKTYDSRLSTAKARGSSKCCWRKASGSWPHFKASSSTKDSMANTLAKAPSARMAEVRKGMTVSRWLSTCRLGTT